MDLHRAEPVVIDNNGESYAVALSVDGMHVVIENQVGDSVGSVWVERRVWPRIVEAVAVVLNRARVLAEAENAVAGALDDEEERGG